MKALEDAIKEIKTLNPDELMRVYDMILELKNRRKIKARSKRLISSRTRVVEALKSCHSDFADDIINHRTDRL